jgi:DNA-binding transcriptional LysR family regulator
VKLFDAIGPELLAMMERGDLHVAQSSIHALQPDDHRFGHLPLAPVEILAACHPSLKLGEGPTIDIGRLAPYPLLLQDPAFVVRRVFDAACRLAGLKLDILLESRAPHTLVAMAEAGHGIAVIPSALRTSHYKVRIFGVTYRGKPLREQLVILWDKRRPLPRYATSFCEMVAAHFRNVFPISRPSAADQDGTSPRRGPRR